MGKHDRWQEKAEAHRAKPRTPPAEVRADVERLLLADLEGRVRTAEVWGVEEARAVVAGAALAWAREVLGMEGL